MKRPKGRYYYYPAGSNFTHGTFEDFAADNLTPVDGMQLGFYDGDLLFEGTVRYDHARQKWKVEVDQSTFREYQEDSI